MNLLSWIGDFYARPEMITTAICGLLAALVLTQHTRIRGLTGFVINAIVLLGGAFGAIYVTRGMDLPLGYFLERTLLVSFGGILASSLLVLLVFSRPNRE